MKTNIDIKNNSSGQLKRILISKIINLDNENKY